jgi:hypothetical protein
MAYSTTETAPIDHDEPDMSTGRATLGAIGLFAALGVGLAFFAFAAAFGLRNVTDVAPDDFVSGISAVTIALIPFIAAPILSTSVGGWAGTRTKLSGAGAIAGAAGALVGTIVMFLLVALGFWLGGLASGVDYGAINYPQNIIPPNLANPLGYLASLTGILYLVGNAIIGAVAGSIAGALVHRTHVSERRVATRRPVRV